MKFRSRSLRLAAGVSVALLAGLLLAGTASAHEPLDDGDYQIVLPDGATIDFTVSDTGQTLAVTGAPATFTTETDADLTIISDGTVRVEIKTGEEGEIEVHGLEFVVGSTAAAQLPNAGGTVTVVVLSDGLEVLVPIGWSVGDIDDDGRNIEVRVTNGTVTYELEVDLEDGTIEMKRVDDDDNSSDDTSDASDDDGSDDVESVDDPSDDDDSSLDSTTSTSSTSTTTTTAINADDDVSSDDSSSDDAASDDDSDDDSGSND